MKIGYVEKSDFNFKSSLVDCYKVFTPYANNIGTELNDDNLNTLIGVPGTICTKTYILLGYNLDLTLSSANNLSNYFSTKFARFLHSIAKASQHGTAKTYRFVPLQDFTEKSDIEWDKPITKIDEQLYAKYGLTKEEVGLLRA
jgi:hypothetical protein